MIPIFSYRTTIGTLAAILAAIVGGGAASLMADDPRQVQSSSSSAGDSDLPQAEQLAQWISDLESPAFHRRQAASRHLSSAGPAAIPALKDAVQSGSLESIARSLSILRDFHLADQPGRSAAARDALAEIRIRSAKKSSNRSVAAIRQIESIWQDDAVRRLSMLGAKFSNREGVTIDLGKGWTGDDQDLKHFSYIRGLRTLNMADSSVNDDALMHLSTLASVNTVRINVGGPGLVHLRNMPSLTFLSLKGSELDAGALKFLNGCDKLQNLGLDETNVTDDDLSHLAPLPQLRNLWLNRTRVTDAGLPHLKKHAEIRKIILTGLNIRGPGLEHLVDLKNLEYLSLQHASCDDACMPYIGKLTHLKTIGLDDTNVTDAGMSYVTTLTTNLDALWLTNTQVSDESVAHLKQLVTAQRIVLSGTPITRNGVNELRRALPACKIQHNFRRAQPR
ncbi:MAG: hypothetical protein HKN47_14085 [Pirellulaceae bacterium]|nr:hypothetical protein [Pirellulaceae bacterium]